MTDEFETTVEVDQPDVDGTIIKVSTDERSADFSTGAGIDLDFTVVRERITTTFTQGFSEAEAQALIDAMTAALERSRAAARERGYYDWVDDGKPAYGPPYAAFDDPDLEDHAKPVLRHLLSHGSWDLGVTAAVISGAEGLALGGVLAALEHLAYRGYAEVISGEGDAAAWRATDKASRTVVRS